MLRQSQIVFLFVLLALGPVACRNTQGPAAIDQEKYLTLGDSLSRVSFDTLRNTLLARISADGLTGAVRFCKVEASTLTKTYGTAMQEISRTSLRYRNPENRPDSLSEQVLKAMQAVVERGEKPAAQLVSGPGGTIHYYKPILMQSMCLNCHGSIPVQLKPEIVAVIDSLYPGDLARNYKEGELRGAWHIRFIEVHGR
jgi:hypothetical protein